MYLERSQTRVLNYLLRARALEQAPRPVFVAAGLLVAGLLVALAHGAGPDVGGTFGGGQSGLLPSLFQALPSYAGAPELSHEEAPAHGDGQDLKGKRGA